MKKLICLLGILFITSCDSPRGTVLTPEGFNLAIETRQECEQKQGLAEIKVEAYDISGVRDSGQTVLTKVNVICNDQTIISKRLVEKF